MDRNKGTKEALKEVSFILGRVFQCQNYIFQILPTVQQQLWEKLSGVEELTQFYLAGGTGLGAANRSP